MIIYLKYKRKSPNIGDFLFVDKKNYKLRKFRRIEYELLVFFDIIDIVKLKKFCLKRIERSEI